MGWQILEGFDLYQTGTIYFGGSPWLETAAGIDPTITTAQKRTGRAALLYENDGGGSTSRPVNGGSDFDYVQFDFQVLNDVGGFFESRNPAVCFVGSLSQARFGTTNLDDNTTQENTGYLCIRRGDTLIKRGNTLLQKGVWYNVECFLSTDGQYFVWLDGQLEMGGQMTPIGSPITFLRLRRGNGASSIGSKYFDNILYGSDIGYLPPYGAQEIIYLMPDADMTPDDWLFSSGLDGYALIDEQPYDDNNYIYAENQGDEARFAIEGPAQLPASVRHVFAVQPIYRALKDQANVAEINMTLIFERGDLLQDYPGATVSLAQSANYYFGDVQDNRPHTNTPWTPSDLEYFSIQFDRIS